MKLLSLELVIVQYRRVLVDVSQVSVINMKQNTPFATSTTALLGLLSVFFGSLPSGTSAASIGRRDTCVTGTLQVTDSSGDVVGYVASETTTGIFGTVSTDDDSSNPALVVSICYTDSAEYYDLTLEVRFIF